MVSRLGLFGSLVALTLSAGQAAAQAVPAGNPIVGTWKLNVAKSTFTPGPGWQSQTRTYRATPGGASVSWTGVGAHGETMQVSYDYNYDGKDYPMVGSANYDTLNAIQVDAFTVKSEEKRDGKIVGASTEAYSSKANCISNAERNGMTCTPR